MNNVKIKRKLIELVASGAVLTLLLSSVACSKKNDVTEPESISEDKYITNNLNDIDLILFEGGVNICTVEDLPLYESEKVVKKYSLAFLKENFPNLPIDDSKMSKDNIKELWSYLQFDFFDDNDSERLNSLLGYTDIYDDFYLCYSKEEGYYYDNDSYLAVRKGSIEEIVGENVTKFIVNRESVDEFGNPILVPCISNFDLYLFEVNNLSNKNLEGKAKQIIKE